MNVRTIKFLPVFIILAILSQALPLLSCDDGYIQEPTYTDSSLSYKAIITGNFTHLKTWSGDYSVAAAAYDGESSYSLVQKVLPSSATDTSLDTLVLNNVPLTSKTIEIAVSNRLRLRIASLFTYEIPADQRLDDTIRIDVGTLDVGMFGTINRCVLQNTSVNCSRCHASAQSTAHLDLTTDHAYSSFINVDAYRCDTLKRVLPGDADKSFLYHVITDGGGIKYNHNGLFSDIPDFLEIIKSWINGGAKE